MKKLLLILSALCACHIGYSQGKAWEFGIGATVKQMDRISFSDFNALQNGYDFDLTINHSVVMGNIYIAKQMNDYFYLDLQGNLGSLKDYNKRKLTYDVGLGVQWRLGKYFNSNYIEPYIRAGIYNSYRDFLIQYNGSEGLIGEQMSWIVNNIRKTDKKHAFPFSAGIGFNLWLNDRFGIGLQGDYMMGYISGNKNYFQGTARLMWRVGGKSKKAQPVYVYNEVPVEKIVEKVVTEEKIIYVPSEVTLYSLIESIYFDFDSTEIKDEYKGTVQQIADIIKSDDSKKYLVTGYADSKGNQKYNQSLSERRAMAIVDALHAEGVSDDNVKAKGVSNRSSHMNPSETNYVREGDRKVTIELVTNMEYWNKL